MDIWVTLCSYYRTIFSNKITWLPLHCFAFFNTNVHFCTLCVWQNCGIYTEIVCGSMQRYANSMCYLVAPPVLSFRQYCYFDGFWLKIFSVQFSSVQFSSLIARMGRKDVTTKTYIQTRLVDHLGICIHLTTHLHFTCVISDKIMHPISC